MNLFIRNGVYYCDARSLGLGKFSTKESTKAKARISATAIISAKTGSQGLRRGVANVISLAGKGITLGESFNQAVRNEWKDYAKPTSIEGNYKYAQEYFGDHKLLRDITQTDVIKFKEWLSKQPKLKAQSSINKKLLIISSLMNLARDDWGHADVPKLAFKIQAPKTKRRFIYSPTQVQSLVDYFTIKGDDYMADLIVFLSETGMRLGEAMRFKASDIRNGVIAVWQTKTDDPRGVPVSAKLRLLLSTSKRQDFSEYKEHHIETRFNRARVDLSLPDDATLHGLRHTFATMMIEATGDIQVVQEMLGHSNITTTTIYAKMTNRRTINAMQLFDKQKEA